MYDRPLITTTWQPYEPKRTRLKNLILHRPRIETMRSRGNAWQKRSAPPHTNKNDVTSTVPGKEMDCPTVDNREVYLGMPTNAIYCHHSLVVVGSPPSSVRTHDKDQQLCPHVLSCPHHAFVELSQVVEEEGVCPFYEIHRATHTYTLQERMRCTATTIQGGGSNVRTCCDTDSFQFHLSSCIIIEPQVFVALLLSGRLSDQPHWFGIPTIGLWLWFPRRLCRQSAAPKIRVCGGTSFFGVPRGCRNFWTKQPWLNKRDAVV